MNYRPARWAGCGFVGSCGVGPAGRADFVLVSDPAARARVSRKTFRASFGLVVIGRKVVGGN